MQIQHSLEKNRALLGRREEVLVEGPSKKDPGRMTGKTRSYKTVNFAGDKELIGRVIHVRIRDAQVHSLLGERE